MRGYRARVCTIQYVQEEFQRRGWAHGPPLRNFFLAVEVFECEPLSQRPFAVFERVVDTLCPSPRT